MSKAATIAAAVKTSIETLTGEPTVEIREHLVLTDADLAVLPKILIRIDDEADEDRTFGGTINRFYTFEILTVYARNQKVTATGEDTARDWREDVMKRLVPDWTASPVVVLSGVSDVWDMEIVQMPGQAQDEALHRSGYQTGRLGVGYRTNESAHV